MIGVGASFVPGGKGLLTAGAAVVGSATGVASLGLGVAAHSPVGYGGAAIGVAGHYTSNAAALLEGAKGVASYLPYAGQALAIGGLLYDAGTTLSEAGCFGSGE